MNTEKSQAKKYIKKHYQRLRQKQLDCLNSHYHKVNN